MNENEFLNFILNKVAIETTGIAIISALDLEEFKIDDVTLFEKINYSLKPIKQLNLDVLNVLTLVLPLSRSIQKTNLVLNSYLLLVKMAWGVPKSTCRT